MTREEKIQRFEELKAQGMKNAEAARAMGVSPGAYWQWKNPGYNKKTKKPVVKRAEKKASHKTIVIEDTKATHVFVFSGPSDMLNKVLEKING